MKPVQILVVDDEENVVELMRHILKEANFDVICAYGGTEGIRYTIDNHPDLVISDVMMPDVDGIEFLTKLKEKNIRTRFIFMTAVYTSLRDTVRFIKLGACDVIHKPR